MEQYTPPKEVTFTSNGFAAPTIAAGRDGPEVAISLHEEFAAELARRYNCHEELVKACRDLLEQVEAYSGGWGNDSRPCLRIGVIDDMNRARAALDIAEKK